MKFVNDRNAVNHMQSPAKEEGESYCIEALKWWDSPKEAIL
jgi:hypothetical protein